MKKRLTIADYQEANQKLIEERATLTRERDEARKERDEAKNAIVQDRNDLLELLGGRSHYGEGILSRSNATKVQIARRAGELVAHERLSERLGRIVFDDHVEISGAPLPPFMPASEMKSRILAGEKEFAHVEGGYNKPHVHTMECLPPEMRKGAQKIVDDLTASLTDALKRRQRRRRFWSFVRLVLLVAFFVAVGYFGAQAIFG